jgi:hypothetical protein
VFDGDAPGGHYEQKVPVTKVAARYCIVPDRRIQRPTMVKGGWRPPEVAGVGKGCRRRKVVTVMEVVSGVIVS